MVDRKIDQPGEMSRRTFLRKSGVVTAATVLNPQLVLETLSKAQNPDMAELIGTGKPQERHKQETHWDIHEVFFDPIAFVDKQLMSFYGQTLEGTDVYERLTPVIELLRDSPENQTRRESIRRGYQSMGSELNELYDYVLAYPDRGFPNEREFGRLKTFTDLWRNLVEDIPLMDPTKISEDKKYLHTDIKRKTQLITELEDWFTPLLTVPENDYEAQKKAYVARMQERYQALPFDDTLIQTESFIRKNIHPNAHHGVTEGSLHPALELTTAEVKVLRQVIDLAHQRFPGSIVTPTINFSQRELSRSFFSTDSVLISHIAKWFIDYIRTGTLPKWIIEDETGLSQDEANTYIMNNILHENNHANDIQSELTEQQRWYHPRDFVRFTKERMRLKDVYNGLLLARTGEKYHLTGRDIHALYLGEKGWPDEYGRDELGAYDSFEQVIRELSYTFVATLDEFDPHFKDEFLYQLGLSDIIGKDAVVGLDTPIWQQFLQTDNSESSQSSKTLQDAINVVRNKMTPEEWEQSKNGYTRAHINLVLSVIDQVNNQVMLPKFIARSTEQIVDANKAEKAMIKIKSYYLLLDYIARLRINEAIATVRGNDISKDSHLQKIIASEAALGDRHLSQYVDPFEEDRITDKLQHAAVGILGTYLAGQARFENSENHLDTVLEVKKENDQDRKRRRRELTQKGKAHYLPDTDVAVEEFVSTVLDQYLAIEVSTLRMMGGDVTAQSDDPRKILDQLSHLIQNVPIAIQK